MTVVTAAAPAVVAAPTLEQLSAFVHDELCKLDHLDPAQTPLRKTPLVRRGKSCGLVFHVEGPRLLRTSAVWTADEARVIVYDSTGKRVREVKLSESPAVGEA
jgi:hypothetical protein